MADHREQARSAVRMITDTVNATGVDPIQQMHSISSVVALYIEDVMFNSVTGYPPAFFEPRLVEPRLVEPRLVEPAQASSTAASASSTTASARSASSASSATASASSTTASASSATGTGVGQFGIKHIGEFDEFGVIKKARPPRPEPLMASESRPRNMVPRPPRFPPPPPPPPRHRHEDDESWDES